MRTAFFIVGTIAALAGWAKAIDLDSKIDVPADADSTSDSWADRK